MRYFGALRSDLRRLFSGLYFYLACLLVAAIAFFNIWPELQAFDGNLSVYYLLKVRSGAGAFLIAMTVAVVLPYGLSWREDLRHNYIHCLESRVRETAVGWAHVIGTAVGAFLAVFLGYLLCYGLLALRLPMIGELEMEEILRLGADGYEGWIYYGQPLLYFLTVFFSEGMGYAFMAVFALMVSARVKNAFLVLSAPIMLYYGSTFVCSMAQLPGIFWWYNIFRWGGYFTNHIPNGRLVPVVVFLYFLSLICIEGLIFTWWTERRRRHG